MIADHGPALITILVLEEIIEQILWDSTPVLLENMFMTLDTLRTLEDHGGIDTHLNIESQVHRGGHPIFHLIIDNHDFGPRQWEIKYIDLQEMQKETEIINTAILGRGVEVAVTDRFQPDLDQSGIGQSEFILPLKKDQKDCFSLDFYSFPNTPIDLVIST